MVIIIGNEHRDQSSNPGRMRLFAFHIVLNRMGKVCIQLLSLQLWVCSKADWVL